jgi:hypothetical protein
MPAAFARGRLGGFQFSGWGRKSSSLTGWLGFTPAPVLTPGSPLPGHPGARFRKVFSWHFDVAILNVGFKKVCDGFNLDEVTLPFPTVT